jgi:hypothetical protein
MVSKMMVTGFVIPNKNISEIKLAICHLWHTLLMAFFKSDGPNTKTVGQGKGRH